MRIDITVPPSRYLLCCFKYSAIKTRKRVVSHRRQFFMCVFIVFFFHPCSFFGAMSGLKISVGSADLQELQDVSGDHLVMSRVSGV